MMNAINQIGQDYYNRLPLNIAPTVCRSAIYTFGVSFLLYSLPSVIVPGAPIHIARPLLATTAATLACTIYALVTPLFDLAFNNNQVTVHHNLLKHIITVGITYSLTCFIPAFKTYWLTISALELIPLNYVSEIICHLMGEIDKSVNIFNNLIGAMFFGGVPYQRSQLEAEVRNFVTNLGINFQNGENVVYYMLPAPSV